MKQPRIQQARAERLFAAPRTNGAPLLAKAAGINPVDHQRDVLVRIDFERDGRSSARMPSESTSAPKSSSLARLRYAS